jgi:hypothetical protein
MTKEFFPSSPSSIDGADGSRTHSLLLMTKLYSWRPVESGRIMVQTPFLSGPVRRACFGSHWLKLPAIATLFAEGAKSEKRTPLLITSGAGDLGAQPVSRRRMKILIQDRLNMVFSLSRQIVAARFFLILQLYHHSAVSPCIVDLLLKDQFIFFVTYLCSARLTANNCEKK